MFWAFSLFLERLADKLYCYRVSMLSVLSFFFINNDRKRDLDLYFVLMLNVLSFFFVPLLSGLKREFYQCFDTQCSELFLYGSMIFYLRNGLDKFRCSMFWAFSLFDTLYFIIYKMQKFRCSMFWAFSL